MSEMKQMMRITVFCLAVVSLTALAACKDGHGHGQDPAKLKSHVDKSLKKIGASEEQRTKVGAVSDAILADCKGLHEANKGVGKQVAGCLLSDQPDRQWLHRTVDDKARQLTDFAHRTVDRLVEISQTLTPEQRVKLKEGFEKAHGK